MNAMAQETARLLELLPEQELKTVNDLVKMLVRAWDPDFTKVTMEERQRIDAADKEMKAGIFYSEEDVWN